MQKKRNTKEPVREEFKILLEKRPAKFMKDIQQTVKEVTVNITKPETPLSHQIAAGVTVALVSALAVYIAKRVIRKYFKKNKSAFR